MVTQVKNGGSSCASRDGVKKVKIYRAVSRKIIKNCEDLQRWNYTKRNTALTKGYVAEYFSTSYNREKARREKKEKNKTQEAQTKVDEYA